MKIPLSTIVPIPSSHSSGQKRILITRQSIQSGITQIAVTKLKKSEKIQLHVHPTMEEFFIIRNGHLLITVGEDEHDCVTDDFVYVPAGVEHSLEPIEDTELLTIGCALSQK